MTDDEKSLLLSSTILLLALAGNKYLKRAEKIASLPEDFSLSKGMQESNESLLDMISKTALFGTKVDNPPSEEVTLSSIRQEILEAFEEETKKITERSNLDDLMKELLEKEEN